MAAKRILVVDDEQVVCTSITAILEIDGHSTECVNNAFEALSRYSPDKYDLIVTDNRMPGMTGVELAEKIRSRHPAQRIMLLTGFPPLRPTPVVDVILIKPFSGDALRETVLRLTNSTAES
jgi:CheY-like chemotaxis protein